jgi:hypothetical protein
MMNTAMLTIVLGAELAVLRADIDEILTLRTQFPTAPISFCVSMRN